MRVLSLFSGIGGLDLGLERAGMTIVAHAEVNSDASAVLARHWPDVPNLGDVNDVDWESWRDKVDIVAAGFPCQDVSSQGARAGIKEGNRSGLYFRVVDAVRVIRPRYVIVENVGALLARGVDIVLGELASLGYDAEWDCVPASAVGAPHQRDRVFVVAYPGGERQPRPWRRPTPCDPAAGPFGEAGDALNAFREGALPIVCRRHDGVPPRLGKPALTGLGNAVVPAVAEHIGRIVMDMEHQP